MTISNHKDNEEKVLVNDPALSSKNNHKVNHKDSYEGRKHKPEIDGPQQDSQETDEVYSDPRREDDLPAGGKNVANLNPHDLSQKGNE